MAPAAISATISNVARWFAQQPPKRVTDSEMSAFVRFTSQNSCAQGGCQALRREYLVGVEEPQDCDGQLGEEDQCQAEGELEQSGH